jgi:hypothetical membrane protein
MLIILYAFLLGLAASQSSPSQAQVKSSGIGTLYLLSAIAAILIGIWYYDKRNHNMYSRALRGAIGDCIVRYKNKKNYRR